MIPIGKLDFYLWKKNFFLTLPIFLVLVILFFSSTLGELAQVFNQNDLPLKFLPKILLAQLPELSLLLIGISLYISIIVNLSMLNKSQESIIMMAVGLSKAWFLRNVLIFSAPFLIVIFYISFFLTPLGLEKSKNLLFLAKNEFKLNFKPSSLNNLSKDLMIYVQDTNPNGSLKGVIIKFQSKTNSSFITAESGFEYQKNNQKWLKLYKATIYNEASQDINLTYSEEVDFSLTHNVDEKHNNDFKKSLRMTSTAELLNQMGNKAKSELMWRLSYVLTALFFCTFAVFLVKYTPRKSALSSVIPALVVFLIYSKIIILIRQNTEQGLWFPEVAYGFFYLVCIMVIIILWLQSDNKLTIKNN